MATNEIKITSGKVSIAQLTKGEAILNEKGYGRKSNNLTGYYHLVAYATKPMVNADAVNVAKALFVAKGISTPFSDITTLHTTPKSLPRIYKTKSLRRYSADFNDYFFGTVRFACVTHGLNRTKCEVTCLQGLFDVASEQFLGQLAGTYKPVTKTPSKPIGKRTSKNGSKATKTENNSPMVKPSTDIRLAATEGDEASAERIEKINETIENIDSPSIE